MEQPQKLLLAISLACKGLCNRNEKNSISDLLEVSVLILVHVQAR